MESKTYSIPNISCMHCVNKIQETILALEGVDFAEADPTSKQLEVEFEAPCQRSTDQRSIDCDRIPRQISMSEKEHLNLPVIGMTCANCAVSVERALKRTDGVDDALVNLSSERVAVSFEADKTNLNHIVESIQNAGFQVATGKATFLILS